MEVRKTQKFSKWLKKLDKSQRVRVVARIEKIQEDGQFGLYKDLGDGLSELKFQTGIRVYYITVEDVVILLLAGGGKDEQKRQIVQLKKDIIRYY